MDCNINAETLVCEVCGKPARAADIRRNCGPPTAGLGDVVAEILAAVGITPERVEAFTGKPCGCKQRQQRLNQAGYRLGIGSPPDGGKDAGTGPVDHEGGDALPKVS